MLGAFVASARSGAFTVRQTWRYAPAWLIRLVLANLLLALAPSAQVLAVAWLVRSAGNGTAREFFPPLLTLVVLVAVGQVASNATNMTQQRVRTRMRRHYQDELMRTVAALPPQRLAQAKTTALIEAVRGSLFDMGHLVGSVIASVAALVAAASLGVTVWTISPLAGVLVVAALVPFLLAYAWESKMQDRQFARHGFWERRTNYAVEQLVNQRTATELATLGSGATVAEIADGYRTRADSIMDRLLALVIRADLVGATGTALMLGGALAGIVIGGAGGAGIAAGIVAVLAGLEATRNAGFSFGDLISFGPKVAAYRRLVDSRPDEPIQTPTRSASGIEVTGITVSYPGRDHPAVSDVSLSVGPGTIVALVGVNGAGKTTTVNAIIGLLDPDEGMITVDDLDLATLPTRERLAMFGLLTQEFGRYEFTVRDVVRIGRADGVATDEEIWQALESAHAKRFIQELPDGLDTQLGSQFGGVGLSGGQWQRLSLARIYLRDAPIWILDEPTSAIDAEAEQQIFAELQRTKADRVTIVVSHRAWTLKGMDHIYVFDDGRVVDHGTYDQLLSRGGRFADIFAEQF